MSETRPVDVKRIERPRLIDWLVYSGANYALTLNPNREMSPQNLGRLFGKLMKSMDEKVTGHRRAGQLATEDRIWAMAFIEHPETNIHLHVALALKVHQLANAAMDEAQWREFIDARWSSLTKGSGSIDLQLATSAFGWGEYITKEMLRHGHDYILAADYHPDAAVGKGGYESIEFSVE